MVGLVLIAAYVVQAWFGLAWPWLAHHQDDDTYKAISGCVLAGYLGWQWWLGARRLVDPVGAVRRHKLAGACAPLVLYAHAARPGYGYLLVLAAGYLSVAFVGLLHGAAMRARRVFALWFIVHVATATLLLILGAYHVVIAIAYE